MTSREAMADDRVAGHSGIKLLDAVEVLDVRTSTDEAG
jgi:hypothetical protein